MKSKSSTDYNGISNIHVLIKHARVILTLLMNQIIHTGEFPDQLKLSSVKPLFKIDKFIKTYCSPRAKVKTCRHTMVIKK